jgi:2-polyprenyl-3-methyl-5-hydroxy-6-metoxy-1,4-benzoquinol methylase
MHLLSATGRENESANLCHRVWAPSRCAMESHLIERDMNRQRTADDYIYTSNSLDSIPHRIRVRKIIAELKRLAPLDCTYADVGCGGGFVTQRVVGAIRPRFAVGYDLNEELIASASKQFKDISFRVWDASKTAPPADRFELVTCLETLEHVGNLKLTIDNLLAVTSGILLVTVPIEIGLFGTLKFVAKRLLRREVLGAEHSGFHME